MSFGCHIPAGLKTCITVHVSQVAAVREQGKISENMIFFFFFFLGGGGGRGSEGVEGQGQGIVRAFYD